MSLFPSNMLAQASNPQAKVFRNIARHTEGMSDIERSLVFDEVDEVCLSELREAGIKAHEYEAIRNPNAEVPTKAFGSFCQWSFKRAWYYWIAEGPGIPPDIAEEFHQTWGTQCRVDGHCGCPSPKEWHRGFAVGLYHIDTQEGLNAFAKLLGSIYEPEETSV